MYTPSHFREERIEVLSRLIRTHPLAALVTAGDQGLAASHIPLVYDPIPEPFGTLRGHVARMNPQWRDASPRIQALAIFTGLERYISPS